ncbi:hypothetical protein F4775DRAFT_83750 [Biscogniauxia sp. FL1348]|nr:hypothetical protein F4775DRAFT_83750 [Biscogniauxia sp. FL1348]
MPTYPLEGGRKENVYIVGPLLGFSYLPCLLPSPFFISLLQGYFITDDGDGDIDASHEFYVSTSSKVLIMRGCRLDPKINLLIFDLSTYLKSILFLFPLYHFGAHV